MPDLLTCLSGHQWPAAAGQAGGTEAPSVRCPICGGLATTPCCGDATAALGSRAQPEADEESIPPTVRPSAPARIPLRPTTPCSGEETSPLVSQAKPEPDQDSIPDTVRPSAPAGTPPPDSATDNLDPFRTRLPETPGGIAPLVIPESLPEVAGYEILALLGRGGMGVVYQARHLKLKRLVALKMILAGAHAGRDELVRFRTEAEAAARLQHPHVVQIYEIGEQDGLPYFSLEFVDGGSLAQKLDGTPMPPRQAADLVRALARGMHAAHERGIVHRDLKPANVLLAADGTPKITDFGLAKKLDDATGQTATGDIMGTPSYMAPEQASGHIKAIGPATDVYALGAILYETLTGRPPFKGATIPDTVVQVLNQEPVSPRRLQPQVPTDLETICQKCLQKEPAKRYASAAALADDLERFLRGEPIRARPVSLWERSVKWARRRPAVTALLATVLLGGIGGFLGMTGLWLRAEEMRDIAERERMAALEAKAHAEQERAAAQAVNSFLREDLLGQADISNQLCFGSQQERNPNLTVRELVDRTAAAIEAKFCEHPEIEAAIRETIGNTYLALGEYERAQDQLDKAVAWRREHCDTDHPDTLASLSNLAALYQHRGRYDEAEPLCKEILAIRREKWGPDHVDTLLSLNRLAGVYFLRGRYAEAEPLLQEALTRCRQNLEKDHPHTLLSLNNMAQLYTDTGRYAEAEPLLKEALAGYRRKLGNDHPHTLNCLNNLATLYHTRGQYAETEPLYQEVLAARRRKLGKDHPDTLASLNNLAVLYQDRGQSAKAEPLYQELVASCRRKLGADHPHTLLSLTNLAALYYGRGRYDEAVPLFQEALATNRRKQGDDHPDTLSNLNDLALVYQARGQYAEAEPLFKEALEGKRKRLGADHPDTLIGLHNLARLYQACRRFAEAEPLLREVLAKQRQHLGADHPEALKTLNDLAVLFQDWGQNAEAEPLLQEALRISRQKLGADHPNTLINLNNLARLYRATERSTEAETLYQEAITGARRQLGPAHPTTQLILRNLADLYEQTGKPAQGEALRLELTEAVKKQAGAESPAYGVELALLGSNLLKQRKYADAEPLLRTCLAIRQRTQPDAWTTFNGQSLLGEALAGQQKHAEAEPILLAGYEGLKAREQNLSPQSQIRLTEALERLVHLYNAWGKAEQAAAWRQKLDQVKTPTKEKTK